MVVRPTRHAVYNIIHHLVWCPRYRRQVLNGPVAVWLDRLIRFQVAELDGKIIALQVQPDHGHLFAEFPPTLAVPEIVRRLKGYTAYAPRQEFRWLKSHPPAVWTRPYYVGTARPVPSHTTRRYIEPQKDCRVQKER